MHGRLKVKTTAEQDEAKKKAREEKLKIYRIVTKRIFEKRENGELDEEALKLTGQMLEQNPDFYTLWNFRREILLQFRPDKTKDELQNYASEELTLTQNCLRNNHKSYGAWHHRFWAMEFFPEPDWKKELKLCGYFLSLDERNFHCWDYRRLICKKCEVDPGDELLFTTDLIEKNFSNYSAWHYRSKLLPLIHPGSMKESVNEEILLKEFQLVQNAAFTDPNDQSVWFYHRWLLGRSRVPLEILNVSVLRTRNQAAVLFSEPIKIDEDFCVEVKINKIHQEVLWKKVNSYSSVSSIWICDLPSQSFQGDGSYEVAVELMKETEKNSLTCYVNGSNSFVWNNTSRAHAFRSELSAATKEVLVQELQSCQQLYEFEPDNKWTLFTSILLMRALNDQEYEDKIREYMKQLRDVDSQRKEYYEDLGSKFSIENVIETLPVETEEVSFANRCLSSLHHFEQLLLVRKIDLSQNLLTSVLPLSNLISVETINLDDNKLSSCEGVERLQSLKLLSMKNNYISKVKNVEALQNCPQLKELFLEENEVKKDAELISTIKNFPALKFLDGKAIFFN